MTDPVHLTLSSLVDRCTVSGGWAGRFEEGTQGGGGLQARQVRQSCDLIPKPPIRPRGQLRTLTPGPPTSGHCHQGHTRVQARK